MRKSPNFRKDILTHQVFEQTESHSHKLESSEVLVLSQQKAWQAWWGGNDTRGLKVEQKSHNWGASTTSAVLLHPFLSQTDCWARGSSVQTDVWFLCSSLTNTKGHLNHALTPVSFTDTGEFDRWVSREKTTLWKRHSAHYTSLLLITEGSGVSGAPLHPGAKLSNENQWLPCQNPVWAAALTLKATEETNTTTGYGSVL